MISYNISDKLPLFSNEEVDALNELSPIVLGLRSFMRHNNHKVHLVQNEQKIEITFDPDLICNVEWFPTLYYISLRSSGTMITFADWPIILKVTKNDDIYICKFNKFEKDVKLDENTYKGFLLGLAETIATMARDKGYLTDIQLQDFISGKWKMLNDEMFEKYCNL